ncbi:MAG: HesB/IscA family protein [Acidobacteriaceae bacterium]
MIQLTETAAQALRSAIKTTTTPIAGMRLTVQAGGCSGFQYQMGLVESSESGDISCESQGLAIFIEPSSVALVSGTTIDFTDTLEGSGFSFNNPQAKSTCGCGRSFC